MSAMRITLSDLLDPDSPTRPEIPEDATGIDWGGWVECFDVIRESPPDGVGPKEGTVVTGRPGPCNMHLELGNEHECPMGPDPSDPVGTVEIAQRLGVKRATVDQWRQRKLMPEPDWTVGGRPAWRLGTILAWARETGRL
jgi:predicted DNA-binding transcriptional regulator AlpA